MRLRTIILAWLGLVVAVAPGHAAELVWIEAERFELAREDFDARDAISAVLRLMRGQADRAGISLRGDLSAESLEAEADRRAGWFEVWLIPETLRMTTFGDKREGDALNIEIERGTQVVVDTVRDALDERLGPLLPALEALLTQQGSSIADLAGALALPPR